MVYDKFTSPVDWYIGSYLIQFTEIAAGTKNNDPEARFLSWENTVIVTAKSFEAAYDKVEAIALEQTEPYRGGEAAVPVQWRYLGLTELLPIYEDLEDGAEVMWRPRHPRKLKNLRYLVKNKSEFLQQLTTKDQG